MAAQSSPIEAEQEPAEIAMPIEISSGSEPDQSDLDMPAFLRRERRFVQ